MTTEGEKISARPSISQAIDTVLARKDEEIAEYRKALEFYQNGFYPKRAFKYLPGMEWKPTEELLDDCGNIAKEALAKYPKE